MTLSTRLFRLKLLARTGLVMPGAKVQMQLTSYQVDGPDVVKLVWPLTEEPAFPGFYSGPIWPNKTGSEYLVTADADGLRMQAALMSVPEGDPDDVVSVDLMVNPEPWPATYEAEAEVQAARVFSEAAGESASRALGGAEALAHIYPGTYEEAPTTRPDGSPSQDGDRYVNRTDEFEYVLINGVWVSPPDSADHAAASALQADEAAGIAAQAGTAKIYTGWTSGKSPLSGVVAADGTSALILADTGTHVDPVTAATVSNSGLFRYTTVLPAGWERVGDTDAVRAQDAAASRYGIFVTGAPAPLGIYPVEVSARTTSNIRRFVVKTDAVCTVECWVNGVLKCTALDAPVGLTEYDFTFSVPADAAVEFRLTAGTPTSVWALIDGSRP